MTGKLGVDLDGVCANYHAFVIKAHPEYAEEYSSGKISPDLEQIFNKMATNETYAQLEPIVDSAWFLRDLQEFYEIFYVTSRDPSSYETTVAWLKKYKYPNPEAIIFTSDKGLACVSEGITVLIEDRIKYALQASGLGIKVILLDQPHNKPGSSEFDNRLLDASLIERANCWVDVLFKTYFVRPAEVKSATVYTQLSFLPDDKDDY